MKKSIWALAALLLSGSANLMAQQTPTNLLTNPSFEKLSEYAEQSPRYKYEGWSYGAQLLLMEDTQKPKDGTKSLKIYPSAGGGYLSPVNDDLDLQTYQVGSAEAFTFSFWYRGSIKHPNLETEVRYYNDSDLYTPLQETIIPESAVTKPNNNTWLQKVVEIPIPKNLNGKAVTHIAVLLKVANNSRESGDISVDLFSLTSGGVKVKVDVPKPMGVKNNAYEREIELSWEKSLDPEIRWEIIEGSNTYQTTTPNFILTKLLPNKEYKIKICAVKGEDKSEYTELAVRTSSILKDRNDDTRVPYLRTLAQSDGYTSKVLRLYYNNLYNPDAKFTYWIDGTEVKPNKDVLNFNTVGNHRLKVRIEESPEEIWFLNYNLEITE